MNANQLHEIRATVKRTRPLIHCITNPISINQCANAALAVGARPIMAEHPAETEEITRAAQALVLNLGNITDARMESMGLSAAAAKEDGIPFVLDAVGTACSSLRRNFALTLIGRNTPAVIKGNYSEINALCDTAYRAAGVDAEGALGEKEIRRAAGRVAREYNTVVLASGATDIVTDGKRCVCIQNGTPQLAAVTGTGCMLGALCGCCLTAGDALSAAVTACAVLGVCGELAETEQGSGSFLTGLMDRLSTLSAKELQQHLKLEEAQVW